MEQVDICRRLDDVKIDDPSAGEVASTSFPARERESADDAPPAAWYATAFLRIIRRVASFHGHESSAGFFAELALFSAHRGPLMLHGKRTAALPDLL